MGHTILFYCFIPISFLSRVLFFLGFDEVSMHVKSLFWFLCVARLQINRSFTLSLSPLLSSNLFCSLLISYCTCSNTKYFVCSNSFQLIPRPFLMLTQSFRDPTPGIDLSSSSILLHPYFLFHGS